MEDKRYPLIRRICAGAVGIAFFVAGMLKLMDPVGATLKVQDYLSYFHAAFLGGVAKPLALALAMLESLCGAALLSGVWRRLAAVVTTALLGFFTVLTAVLLVFRANLDCGCFAEAVHMTPLQTFLKNIALCCLVAAAFLPAGNYGAPRKTKYAAFAIAALCAAGLCIWSLDNLPLVDYSEFAPGKCLITASETASEADGTTLMLVDDEDWGRDDRLLCGRHLVFSVYDASKLDAALWARMSSCIEGAYNCGFRPCVAVSADSRDAVPDYIEAPVYSADYRKLIALNRSNGGVTYLEDGQVVCKWKLRDAPGLESLTEAAQCNSTEMMVERYTRPKLVFEALIILPLALMLII